MATFTINSLQGGTLAATDTFLKSDTEGVLTKVTLADLENELLGDELRTYTYKRVNISTADFSGYIDLYSCGKIASFRVRLTAVRTVTRNTEVTVATLSGDTAAFITTIRQYSYGYASAGATFKGAIEFSINGSEVILRNPDTALDANDVAYISGAYIVKQ